LSLWRSTAAAAEFAETDGKHRIMNAEQGRKNTTGMKQVGLGLGF
jgi:hypothetical protein